MADNFTSSDQPLLELLRDHESLTVTQLAERLEVTATAVRQRLQRLLHQGFIERHDERHGRGRPQHQYRLTATGRRKVGENFADLAMVLWQEIIQLEDEDLRRQLVDRIARRLAKKYSADIRGASAEERMQAIATMFGERQIPITVEKESGLPILNVKACPYPDLAEGDTSICEMEATFFSELLGQDVELQRVGDHPGCNCRFGTAHESCGSRESSSPDKSESPLANGEDAGTSQPSSSKEKTTATTR